MTSKNIFKQLQNLGLSENQAHIYQTLVEKGELRIQEIAVATELPRSSVYEALKGLLSLGLVEEIVDKSFKQIKATPIGSLRHNLAEQIDTFQKQLKQIETLEKQLAKPLEEQKEVQVRYYKDVAGARQIFWNSLKAKNTLYVYSEWGRGVYVGMRFYENFVAESKRRRVRERVITNSTPHVINSIKTYANTPISRTKIETIRAVPKKDISFKGDTLMYDDVFAQVYLKDEIITGFEITSKHFVATQRAIFEQLWGQATPMVELLAAKTR